MESGQPKTNKPLLSVERIIAIIVCLFLLWPLVECGLPWLLPKKTDHLLAHTDSPDGKWVAALYERVYASIFSGAEFVVELSGKSFQEIFIIEEDAANQPRLTWRSDNDLVISTSSKETRTSIANSVELQTLAFEGIQISYEIR